MLIDVLDGEKSVGFCAEDINELETYFLYVEPKKKYDCLIRPNAGSQCALLTGITGSGDVIDVKLDTGLRVSGVIKGIVRQVRCRALFRGAVLGCDVSKLGEFSFDAIPSGQQVMLEAWDFDAENLYQASAKVSAGDTNVELVLRKK
jgi:hypothetical protein